MIKNIIKSVDEHGNEVEMPEIDQLILDQLPDLINRAFKTFVSDNLAKITELAEQDEQPNPELMVVATYIGLIQMVSLDGLRPADEVKEVVDTILEKLKTESECMQCTDLDDMEEKIAEAKLKTFKTQGNA